MRKLCLFFTGLFILASAGSAQAAQSVEYGFYVTPQSGKAFFKNYHAPADFGAYASLGEPPFASPIKQTYRIEFQLPKQVRFDSSAKVCTADIGQVNPESANVSSDAVRGRCQGSLVGSGEAAFSMLQLMGATAYADISIFNAGRSSSGGSLLYVHGYSEITNRGILMTGDFRNGLLTIDVPPLSMRGAVYYFDVRFPGQASRTRQFVRAVCNTGSYKSKVTFHVGVESAGSWTDQETYVSGEKNRHCKGVVGKPDPKLSVTVKSPVKVRRSFPVQVKVANASKAGGRTKKASLNVRTSLAGPKRLSVPVLAPGQSKTYNLKYTARNKGAHRILIQGLGRKAQITVRAK